MSDIIKSCAVTGHRPHKLPWGQDEESPSCISFQESLLIRIMLMIDHRGCDTFYTGMSWGTDLLFGEIVAAQREKYSHIKLIGVLPHEDIHVKWHVSYQERYFKLVEACDEIVTLNHSYTKDCYKQRNQYLVDHAQHIIAVFDERHRRSGTLQTINMAKRKGRVITYMNPYTRKSRTEKPKPELRIIK